MKQEKRWSSREIFVSAVRGKVGVAAGCDHPRKNSNLPVVIYILMSAYIRKYINIQPVNTLCLHLYFMMS